MAETPMTTQQMIRAMRAAADDMDNYASILEHSMSARRQLREMLTAGANAIEQSSETYERWRAAGREEAAEVCDAEAKVRHERAEHPWPGDGRISPFPQHMVQESKALTARQLARAIRALSSSREPSKPDGDDGRCSD